MLIWAPFAVPGACFAARDASFDGTFRCPGPRARAIPKSGNLETAENLAGRNHVRLNVCYFLAFFNVRPGEHASGPGYPARGSRRADRGDLVVAPRWWCPVRFAQ